jgi:hypothetical protein
VTFIVVKTTTAFPLITQVRFYEETIDHIRDDHPEIPIDLPTLLHGVSNTLQNPSYIELGNRPNTYVYVDATSTNISGDPLRVPVKLIEGTSGLLKTTYFATPENSPTVLWTRGVSNG